MESYRFIDERWINRSLYSNDGHKPSEGARQCKPQDHPDHVDSLGDKSFGYNVSVPRERGNRKQVTSFGDMLKI